MSLTLEAAEENIAALHRTHSWLTAFFAGEMFVAMCCIVPKLTNVTVHGNIANCAGGGHYMVEVKDPLAFFFLLFAIESNLEIKMR